MIYDLFPFWQRYFQWTIHILNVGSFGQEVKHFTIGASTAVRAAQAECFEPSPVGQCECLEPRRRVLESEKPSAWNRVLPGRHGFIEPSIANFDVRHCLYSLHYSHRCVKALWKTLLASAV